MGPLAEIFSENLIGIQTLPIKKMNLQMSSGKSRPFCLDLSVLKPSPLSIAWCDNPSLDASENRNASD